MILVTGGCGFIGANLLAILTQKHAVRVLDNLSRGNLDYLQGLDFEFVQGDIRDTDVVSQVLQNIDTVIHLAAYGSVVESVADPMENFSINVMGTVNLMQACVKAKVKRFVFASTGGALIGNATPPVNELSLPKPISPYGASKLSIEAYCSAFSASYDFETVCLRFANVYGKYSAHKKGAVTVFIKALLTDKLMTIYGDGSASRDFLAVTDLCQGIAQAVDTQFAQAHTVLHLASNGETTIKALAEMLKTIANKPDHPIEFKPARAGEVDRNFARYDQAKAILGFKPSVELYQGLQQTWQWFANLDQAQLQQQSSDS